MDAARIAELLQPFLELRSSTNAPKKARHSEPPAAERRDARTGEESVFLSPTQLQNISTYIDLLLKWNARINLTSVRDPEEIVTRHFGESLFTAQHLFPIEAAVGPKQDRVGPGRSLSRAKPREPGQDRSSAPPKEEAPDLTQHNPGTPAPTPTLVDLGSGAGFPGIPIKIWSPNLQVTLIESNQKKSTFLREVVRNLTLTNINIFPARAEDYAPASADVVTLRAVEHFEAALRIAARLVAPSGRLAILVGRSQSDSAPKLASGFDWSSPQPIPQSASRVLMIATRP